ncbi:MAG: cytochrome C [Phycisphaerae bacterium]|nr:cytochrome C [Phycisphaerae bacterium]
MIHAIEDIVGPRVPGANFKAHRWRYLLPSGLLLVAASLLVVSFWQPYWRMRLYAPQYPKGLRVVAYLNRLEGDVREIDGLNHYIGMRRLNEAAQLERRTSAILVGVLACLLCAAIFVHSPWAALAALPALLWPFGFLVDLHLWMAHFGTHLDPAAALSSSIKPFVPPVLGEGLIGQFRTVARVSDGWRLSLAAAGIVLVALWFHRAAYKPLRDEQRRAARTTTAEGAPHA